MYDLATVASDIFVPADQQIVFCEEDLRICIFSLQKNAIPFLKIFQGRLHFSSNVNYSIYSVLRVGLYVLPSNNRVSLYIY